MELYQIKTFLAVVEEASVTRAAKRLYTTPPSVSAHIKALEEEFGLTLFHRSAKGMTLTSEGIAIRDKAQRILAAVLEVTSEAANLRGQVLGGLEIGLNSSPLFLRATDLASNLRQRHPGLELSFLSSDTHKIIDSIRTQTLDAGFAFLRNTHRDLCLTKLQDTPLSIVVPAQWRTEIPDGDWDALAAHAWVYTNSRCTFLSVVEDAFAARNLEFIFSVKADSDDMRAELVSQGLGTTILETDRAANLVSSGSAFIWQDGESFSVPLYFATLSRRIHEPAIKALTEAIKSAWSANSLPHP